MLLFTVHCTTVNPCASSFQSVASTERMGTEYACDEKALHKAYCAKVTKPHEWLHAKNYWFVPVVAATTGALSMMAGALRLACWPGHLGFPRPWINVSCPCSLKEQIPRHSVRGAGVKMGSVPPHKCNLSLIKINLT